MNVLYLVFNRPHLQLSSFEKIKAARPSKLFVAADGPRRSKIDDLERCAEARRIANQVDWPCDVFTLFRDENLGCRRAVSEAITWFFRHVDEGIILEDDCVASPFFFEYATNLLEYYRNETRVWCISGSNFQNGNWRGDGTYYFSRHSHCWGWATWRRCWLHFDDSMTLWTNPCTRDLLANTLEDPVERKHWSQLWDELVGSSINVDSWAYRWSFTNLINGSLTALPNRNLVTNIGFDGDGTHCQGTTFDPGIEDLGGCVVHPSALLRNVLADNYTFQHIFGGGSFTPNSFGSRIRHKIKNLYRQKNK